MRAQQHIKRVIDKVLALLMLLALSPLLIVVMLVIFIFEGLPLFYNSSRFIAPHDSIFIRKFRSMVNNANSPEYKLEERFMRDGYLDIPLTCEVYTPLGRWLERTQLVETPQLWSILFDKMSFIGNRPLPFANITELKKFDGWEKRFDSPAGISGIAQVVGKFDLQPNERLELEQTYSAVYQNGNILLCDLMILIYTIRLIILGKGIPLQKGKMLLQKCLNSGTN